MKKLLSILRAVGLTATGASSVVACDKSDKNSGEISQLTFVDGKIADGKIVADSATQEGTTGDLTWFETDNNGQ